MRLALKGTRSALRPPHGCVHLPEQPGRASSPLLPTDACPPLLTHTRPLPAGTIGSAASLRSGAHHEAQEGTRLLRGGTAGTERLHSSPSTQALDTRGGPAPLQARPSGPAEPAAALSAVLWGSRRGPAAARAPIRACAQMHRPAREGSPRSRLPSGLAALRLLLPRPSWASWARSGSHRGMCTGCALTHPPGAAAAAAPRRRSPGQRSEDQRREPTLTRPPLAARPRKRHAPDGGTRVRPGGAARTSNHRCHRHCRSAEGLVTCPRHLPGGPEDLPHGAPHRSPPPGGPRRSPAAHTERAGCLHAAAHSSTRLH